MSTVQDQSADTAQFAQQLMENTIGVRFEQTKLGTSRKLNDEQMERIARMFGADRKMLNGSKRLVDTKHARWSAVTTIMSRANSYWKAVTYPWPDSIGDQSSKGVRVMRRDRITEFEEQMRHYRQQLEEAVQALQESWEDICLTAQEKLARLHISADYPSNLDGLFKIGHGYQELSKPPAHLAKMHPELFEREQARIRAKYEESLDAWQQATAVKLNELVQAMVDKIFVGDGEKPRSIRKTNVEGLNDFFGMFDQMNLGSSKELDEVVARAREVMKDVDSTKLNKNQTVRDTVGEAMREVAERLDSMIVERPSRRIRVKAAEPVAEEPGEDQAEEQPTEQVDEVPVEPVAEDVPEEPTEASTQADSETFEGEPLTGTRII